MKKYIVDTETNAIEGYTKLHLVVFRELDSDEVTIFRNIHSNPIEKERLKAFLLEVEELIGHHLIGYDKRVLEHFCVPFCNPSLPNKGFTDTLVISRLLNYKQDGGHSLERWGKYLGYPKSGFDDFSEWSQELEDRCIQDTKINRELFLFLSKWHNSPDWKQSILLEHQTALLCEELKTNGFTFDIKLAKELRNEIAYKVSALERGLQDSFKPKNKLIREITPALTIVGTINAKDFRWLTSGNLTPYEAGSSFSLFETVPFNPRSPKQRIEVLNEAGWSPTEKTDGHLEAIRTRQKDRIEHFKVYGWKCSEENLATLPDDAPKSAKSLSEFLLLSSRLEDLEEWIGLYCEKTGCIHGTFSGIGAWSHRKSHQKPNMANIPALINRKGKEQPYGKAFRSCWTSREGHVLVGCDAAGIQLRVFAHYCNDPRLISGIVEGVKEEKTDIHSVNMSILNSSSLLCKSRESAKTYIYALLLGAQSGKQSEILECSTKEAAEGLERILKFYPGWKKLKDTVIPTDAKRGYFVGLDGRKVMFPSAHHILAGYLQNGESVIMKKACLLWHEELEKRSIPFKFRNDVHDEWQTETKPEYAELVGEIQKESIVQAGVFFNLNCPLAGESTTGINWAITH